MYNRFIIWLTGLSGAGKTTLSEGLKCRLDDNGIKSFLLDGDVLRRGINSDLGFTREERRENARRIVEIAKLFSDAGILPIIAVISPYCEDRDNARMKLKNYNFIEVYVKCSLEECERRDVKGLYRDARKNIISNFTGISDTFETPNHPEIIINTEENDYDTCLMILCKKLGLGKEVIP